MAKLTHITYLNKYMTRQFSYTLNKQSFNLHQWISKCVVLPWGGGAFERSERKIGLKAKRPICDTELTKRDKRGARDVVWEVRWRQPKKFETRYYK